MADNELKDILSPRDNNKTNRERREQEQKQTELLLKVGGITLAVVLLCVLVAVILGIVNKPSRKVVARVGDEKITLDEFQEGVRLQRTNINNNYRYMAQLYAMFGMPVDDATRESYAAQMSDAYKGLLGQTVLSNMVDQRVLAYGAAKEGITVSDDEVEAQYKGLLFGYYPDGTPTAAPTDEPFEATPTITDEQLAILRYTETPLPTEEAAADAAEEAVEAAVEEAVEESVDEAVEEIAEAAADAVAEGEATVEEAAAAVEEAAAEVEEAAVEAVEEAVEEVEEAAVEAVEEVESEAVEAADEAASAEATEEAEPTIAPTPTEYTEDMFKQYESVYFANNYNLSKEAYKNQIRYEMLEEKVKDMLKAGIARSADMVWARHILVETEEEAKEVLERINNGEEWGDVAAEVSLDTSNASKAGDLGWFTEGTMVQAFNDAAFSQEVGTISEPVQTDFGWHLIQVIAHEDHPLTSSEYNTAVDAAYREWLNGYSEQLEINMDGFNSDMVPTDPAFIG